MAYLAQQNQEENQLQSVSITEAGALDQLTGNENVLYSLGSRRAKLVDSEGNTIAKPKKSAISQQQADELKRQQFLKILDEQQKKIKVREDKMKQKQTGIMANAGVNQPANSNNFGNTKGGAGQVNGLGGRWRPGMEQFVNSIKLRSKGDNFTLSMP